MAKARIQSLSSKLAYYYTKSKTLVEAGVLLGLAVALAVIISFGLSEVLNGSTYPLAAVTTGSMIPVYNGFQDTESDEIYPFRGDILLVRKTSPADIEVGDVIVFNVSQVPDPVVHRVIDKWVDDEIYFFKTNGDNRRDPDAWIVEGENVFGVVILRVPHVGWFLVLFQTMAGRIIIIAFAAILLFSGSISEEMPKKKISVKRMMTSKFKYISLILILVFIFLGTNLVAAIFSPPSVELYSMSQNTSHPITNLSHSTDNDTIRLSLPSSSYQWQQNESSTLSTYFYTIRIKVQSGGLFNNIDRIEIAANVAGVSDLYRWTSVYNFIGTKTFEGGITATFDGVGTFSATISLTVYSRGIFASRAFTTSFPLDLWSTQS